LNLSLPPLYTGIKGNVAEKRGKQGFLKLLIGKEMEKDGEWEGGKNSTKVK